MDKYLELFIKNLDHALEAANLGQTELCLKIGKPKNALSKIRHGHGGVPSLTTLREFEDGLGLHPGDLLSSSFSKKAETLKAPTMQDALRIAQAVGCYLLPSSAPREIQELLQLAKTENDWEKVKRALKLALLPGYAEEVLGRDNKKNSG